MLLTVTTTYQPATDLGYLLHKHPDRVQEFKQSFGTATVFYPEATHERCTAALMLEIDPIRLARSRGKNATDFSLAQYVNDRSYAASSLLGVAMADVFSTTRSGRCDVRQSLADSAILLEIMIPVLPCRGGSDVAHRLFEPLGWAVEAEPQVPGADAFAEVRSSFAPHPRRISDDVVDRRGDDGLIPVAGVGAEMLRRPDQHLDDVRAGML